jgi:predicted molibdopterin-dependent oxidoreductase YjgC
MKKPELEKPDNEYPFNLIVGSTLFHFGSGTRSSRATSLMKHLPEAFINICEQDAQSLLVEQGDRVKVVSSNGEVDTVVDITNTVSPGTLFMPISFPETPVYGLFSGEYDAETGSLALKTCAVRLERIENNE